MNALKFAFVILWATAVPTAAQTLADTARSHGRPFGVVTEREFSPADLKDIAKEADLIVRAVVTDSARSYVSEDGREIYSDSTFQVVEEYFSKTVLSGPSIVVTKPGGTVTVSGQQIKSIERDFPPFDASEEYILFLRFDSARKTWIVPFGAQGAFAVLDGSVEQVSKDTGTWNREKGRVPLKQFVQEVHSARSAG